MTWLAFDTLSGEALETEVARAAKLALERLETLRDAPSTYTATFGAFDVMTRELDEVVSLAEHLDEVCGTPAFRHAYDVANSEKDRVTGLIARAPFVKEAFDRFARTDEARTLDPTRQRFVEKTRGTLLRRGANLGLGAQAEYEAVERELLAQTRAFDQAVDSAVDTWSLRVDDAARLSGIPADVQQLAARRAQAAGHDGFVLTMRRPESLAVLTFAHDASLRRELYLALVTAAADTNRARVDTILRLRARRAELLGFESFAELVVSERMLEHAASARAFVDGLTQQLEPAFTAETRTLRDYAATHGQPALEAWDIPYWAERLRVETVGIDTEAVRPFFPSGRVLSALFAMLERTFGITVTPVSGAPTWHPDVSVWEFRDETRVLGMVYVDLYARPGKREGAWVSPLVDGDDRTGRPAVTVLVTDLRPPSRADGQALLSHAEVIRVLHELGHAVHHIVSRAPVRQLNAFRLQWDFVETPSTLFERFAWQRDWLEACARHVETGEPLPASVSSALLASRPFRAVTALMRDLGVATVDLRLHDAAPSGDAARQVTEWLERFSPTAFPPQHLSAAQLTHVFAAPVGYAAGFYAYVWAQVLAAQAFELVVSKEQGRRFKEVILRSGDSLPAAALFAAFTNSAPSTDALLRELRVRVEER